MTKEACNAYASDGEGCCLSCGLDRDLHARHRCDYCDCEVRDGDNGCVSELPPWAEPDATPLAMCWRCEGKLEAAAEEHRVELNIEAAMRAGRFD